MGDEDMKNIFKRTVCLLLAVLMLAGLLVPVTVQAQTYLREEKDKDLKESYTVIEDTHSNDPATGAPNLENEGEQQATDSRSKNLIDNNNQNIDESKEQNNKKPHYISLKLINPGKINYNKGEALSHEGLLVEATDSNGDKKVLDYKGLLADKNINIQEISNKRSSRDKMENILIISATGIDDIVINTYFHDDEIKSQIENLNPNLNPLDNKNLSEEEKIKDEKVGAGGKEENELPDPEKIGQNENDPFMSDIFNLRPEYELTEEELEAGLTKVELPTISQSPFMASPFEAHDFAASPFAASNFGMRPFGAPRFELFSAPMIPVGNGNGEVLHLDGKKFHIITRFETSNEAGSIKPGQFFKIHLDDKLTVNNPTELKPIVHDNRTIATPQYNPQDNTITYTIVEEINDNIKVPLDIPVDYNPAKITLDNDGTFTVTNRVSGLGVKNPKDLIPTKVNKYGIVTNQIIEPGRNDVEKIIDSGIIEDYKVDIDGWARPVIENGQLTGYNWTIKVLSNKDLKELGYKANFTTVKGSGIGVIENKNLAINLEDNPIKGNFGIVDSKHHEATAGINEITYNFYTPVINKQAAYMIDFSAMLANKRDKAGNVKVGAKRFIAEDAYNQNAIGQATPTRVGMNNRTTILGEFTSTDKAKWTVTDAVSTGDDGKLPLANRELSENQTINSSQMAVYGLDADGRMVVKQGVTDLNGTIPAEGSNPTEKQDPGTIAVYEFDTELQMPNETQDYILNGVSISKYRDLYVTQIWNLPVPQEHRKTPKQTIKAVAANDPNTILGQVEVEEKALAEDETERLIRIPNVKYWDIDINGNAIHIDHKIDQGLPTEDITINGTNYRYVENANYYRPDYNDHLLRNTLITSDEQNPVTFKVKKVDSKTGKGLEGARFKLWKSDIEVTTDANGEATFSNIPPDNYQLIETKAPDGYKIDKNSKSVTITTDGKIILSGSNATLSQGIGKTETISDRNYPDYMNAMHYGKLDKSGNLVFYIFLKALDQQRGGQTDRDTRLNIDIPGVTISDVAVFNVNKGQRPYVRSAMERQTVDEEIPGLGTSELNRHNTNIIEGKNLTAADPYTGKTTGYQITFPKERFEDYWGYLVRVKANIAPNTETKIVSYDWLTKENTEDNAKIRQTATISSNPNQQGIPTITVTNEAFIKSSIEVTKFADTFQEKEVNGKKTKIRNVLAGAEFTLKDKDGNVIANKTTDETGKVDFGKFPTGTYTLEETQAPQGYEKSKVYFEVTVNEKGEVSYDPKYLTGSGEPIIGEEYDIQKTVEDQGNKKSPITNVSQRFEIDEDKASSWGTQKSVWEAYRFESLMYHADITFDEVKPGQIFEIQFDKNLDFTQYSSEFPKIKDKHGLDIADPYFDYKTNLLTYVFNNNAPNAAVIASLEIKGIIPSKFYAKNSGDYYFTIEVGPGMENITGNPKIENQKITAYYDTYDRQSRPTQSYYFRDIYKKGEDWYITAIAYYNPEANYSGDGKTLSFNWMSTRYNSRNSIAFQEGIGVKPAFDLIDVKVYRTEPKIRNINGTIINENMPLSFGVRPEQDPNNYYLVNHTAINPAQRIINSTNGVALTYDPSQIRTTGGIYETSPLTVVMPNVGRYREGYLVEQTFIVTNLKDFVNLSRVFYMDNGKPNYQRSAFITSANFNSAIVDKVGPEIPSFYREEVGLINKKYVPAQFKIIKTNELTGEKLKGASFELKDATDTNKKIIRTSDDNGEVLFTNLPPGRYTLKEVTAPENYVASNAVWQITVFRDGSVKIVETSVSGSGHIYEGTVENIISLPVKNRPVGTNFQVFKKDGDGRPLKGAKFKITKQVPKGEQEYTDEKYSDENGVVNFDPNLTQGTYIIEEIAAPDGYKKLDKKWVLVIDKDGNKKVYNYREQADQTKPKLGSILEQGGVNWVDVAGRSLDGWNLYDNRRTGWTGNYPTPFKMGTRIVAINRTDKYVIQRYVINPESLSIGKTTATIHREKPEYQNMDWYNGNAQKNVDYQVFKLTKPVTGQISDIRLAEYKLTNITDSVTVSKDESHFGETRMKLDLPATDSPLVIDIKIPYKDEEGGVGTGMDWTQGGTIYWKSDYYEKASIIKESSPVLEQSTGIQGSYISDNSLEVTNESKTYSFKIKKYKEGAPETLIEGAIFKLTGPDDSTEDRTMTTGKDGMISFDGLKPGTYKLQEEKPAPGYKKVDKTWTVTIGKDGKTHIKEDKVEANALQTRSAQEEKSFVVGREGDFVTNRSLELPDDLKSPFERGQKASVQGRSIVYKQESDFDQMSLKEKVDSVYGTSLFKRMFPNGITLRETSSLTKSADSNDGLEIGDEIVPEAQRAADDWETVDHENRSRNRVGNLSASYSETKITAINKVDKKFRQVFLIKDAEFAFRADAQFYREPERSKYDLKYNDGTIFRIYKVASGSTLDRPINKNDVTATNRPANINGKGKIAAGPDRGKDKPVRIKALLERVRDGYTGPYYIEIETSYDPSKGVGIGLDYIYGSYYKDNENVKDSYVNEGDINYKHLITTSTTGEGRLEIVPYEEAGKQVTLTIKPRPGYEIGTLTVTDKKGNPITLSGGNPKTFTMPDMDVFVNATFKQAQSAINDVIIDPNIVNGKVTTNKARAREGELVLLTITPDPGYVLDKLLGNNKDWTDYLENGTVSFTMRNFRIYVTATFKRDPNLALISFDSNGGTGTMKNEAVPRGSAYTIPSNGFTPPNGKIFQAWSVGGQEFAPGVPVTIDNDITFTAIWIDKPAETATVTFLPNGGNGTMAAQTIEKGKQYILPGCTFKAPNGKEFDKWEVNGSYYNVGDAITVNANTNVKATWKDITVTGIRVISTSHKTDYKVGEPLDVTNLTIEVSKSDGTTETVNVTSDMVTGFDSSKEATNQTLTITYQGKSTTYNVNIRKDTPQPTTYNIGIVPNTEHGSISAPTSAESGSTVTVTVNPDEGYIIDKIEVLDRNGKVLSQVDTLNNTFTMPDGDVFLKATFKVKDQTQYDITVAQTAGGNVEVNKTKASEGEEITVKVTPQQGYEVGQVTANGQVLLLQNGEYKFKMPANNVRISATFNKIEYQTYFIGISGDSSRGSVSVDDPKSRYARAGQEVKFTVKPNPGFAVNSVSIRKADGSGTLNTLVFNGRTGTFTMPSVAVTINVSFKEYTPPDGSYSVTLGTGIIGGTFEFEPSVAKPGEKIRLTVLPKPGYKVKSYKATYAETGVNVPIETDEQGLYFIMPKANVSVNGTFDYVGANAGAYDIKLSTPEHGSLSANFQKANAGAEIHINATPENGYALDTLTVTADNGAQIELKGNMFIMPASAVSVSASFKEVGVEVPPDSFAGISNKQVGLELKLLKRNQKNQPLPGGIFKLKKATDKNYEAFEDEFGTITAVSDEKGVVEFRDDNGNKVVLPVGYYLLEEAQAPLGYKKPQAPWKIEVYEENGQLKARYNGPDDTPSNFINNAGAQDANSPTLTDKSGIKYKSRMIYISPQSKTYIQRIYIDTRGYKGDDVVNVQINPVIKREERDTAGQLPETLVPGVKTAYRSTYRISDAKENYTEAEIDHILKYYDLSEKNVTMINTARWRPFDWGFDEDQLNLKKGVYYIDVEGFYDDNITKEDIGKIELKVDFYKGERKFQQAMGRDNSGNVIWENVYHGSYQQGNKNLGLNGQIAGEKYDQALGKKGGRIEPALDKDKIDTAITSVGIKSLYSSDAIKHIPQDGMNIVNDEETYNVTFSKHGQNDPDEKIDSPDVINRRLEGAVFKLEKARGLTWDDVEKSYVASAFNGYFGFRGLGPGRYRLIEVKAPEGYAPIKGPLLYFTIETASINSGLIANPKTGRNVDINAVDFIFPGEKTGYKFKDLDMIDPKTGKTIKIKDASNLDIATTDIVNPGTNEKVKLKDLTIGFEKNQNGEYGYTYKVSEIQIVPKANGYISLEYDKANGVYQYIPKNGKLVDFVTSATAKNMGKIVNTKPGKGGVKIRKINQAGTEIKASDLKPGAVFKVTNIATGNTKTGIVNEDGIAEIKDLTIGHYTLEEVKSPNGYINTNQVWHFTVGGKDLDPYAGAIAATGVDLTSKISVDTSDMKVLRPDPKDAEKYQNEGNTVIRPHTGQSLEFENKFKLAENTKINPGDYFDLKLSDSISLNGIFVDSTESLDLFADGVGTIAKATYNKDTNTVRYVFTEYAKTYTLVDFTSKMIAFINLNKVKTSKDNIKVGMGTGNDTSKYKDIKLVYDLGIESQTLYGNNFNITSKIVSYDPKTGEFVHYYYINRDKTSNTGCNFYYYPNQDVKNLEIRYIRLKDNSDLSNDMPESFGVDESSSNLEISNVLRSRTLLRVNEREDLRFTEGIGTEDSYIIKVTGTVAGQDKTAYGGAGELKAVYSDGGTVNVNRWDKVYGFENEGISKAEFVIQAVNPDNVIKLKKVNQNDLALAGAQFKVEVKNGVDANGDTVWKATGDVETSDGSGLLEFRNLDPGEYRIVETKAPDGYEVIEGPLVEFRVDKDGKIYRKVPVKNDKGEIVKENGVIKTVEVEEPGIVPIEIINKKGHLIKFKKVDGTDKNLGIQGAEFEVHYKDKLDNTVEYSNKNIKLYEKEVNGVLERRVLKSDEAPPNGFTEVKAFTSGKDGELNFYVYDDGYYALKEIKAPKGYTKIPGFIREFKLEKGEISVYDKDYVKPKESNLVRGLQNMLTSETIAVDNANKTFTQRLVINPNHTSLTFDEYDTSLRLYVDDWNLEDGFRHIKVAVLDKGKTIDDLQEKDFKSIGPSNYNLDKDSNPLRYQLKEMHRSDKDYERPNPNGSNLVTEKTLVVELVGKLNDTSATKVDLRTDVYNRAFNIMIDQVTCKVDTTDTSDAKGGYVKPGDTNPIEIENNKSEYPSTGGIGTIIFTLGGAILMTFAGISYCRKRRKCYK